MNYSTQYHVFPATFHVISRTVHKSEISVSACPPFVCFGRLIFLDVLLFSVTIFGEVIVTVNIGLAITIYSTMF